MIDSKEKLIEYINRDQFALGIKKNKLLAYLTNPIYRFQVLLRKAEYYKNCKKHSVVGAFVRLRQKQFGLKLGFSIPLNVFGPGLSIAHYGTIVINGNSKIGDNCRVQTGVTIGSTNGSNSAPILGNNVFLGDGAKIIGDIRIADDVAVGANAVVVSSILEPGTTWGGGALQKK